MQPNSNTNTHLIAVKNKGQYQNQTPKIKNEDQRTTTKNKTIIMHKKQKK
jgi:hypothetical protein